VKKIGVKQVKRKHLYIHFVLYPTYYIFYYFFHLISVYFFLVKRFVNFTLFFCVVLYIFIVFKFWKNVIIWTLCISLNTIFRGFNEIRNPLKLARIIILSLLRSKFKNKYFHSILLRYCFRYILIMLNIINFWNILVVIYAVLEKSQYYLPWCFLWYHILQKIRKSIIVAWVNFLGSWVLKTCGFIIGTQYKKKCNNMHIVYFV
jgi:hypothetical protein